ncbi:MAG TPA: hypothetical protein VIQ29_22410 [Ancylobacter sp.]
MAAMRLIDSDIIVNDLFGGSMHYREHAMQCADFVDIVWLRYHL